MRKGNRTNIHPANAVILTLCFLPGYPDPELFCFNNTVLSYIIISIYLSHFLAINKICITYICLILTLSPSSISDNFFHSSTLVSSFKTKNFSFDVHSISRPFNNLIEKTGLIPLL